MILEVFLILFQSFNPNEIYNLAGQTSVGLPFCQPVEAMERITKATSLKSVATSKR